MIKGLFEAFGDFVRVGIADVGDSYQRILLQDSALAPPAGPPGQMVTIHDPVPEGPMTDWQLKWLIARQHGYPDTKPKISAPEADEAEPTSPVGLSGTVLPPEWDFSPAAPTQTAIGGAPIINGEYRETKPMVGLPPPRPDEPDMDF